MRSELIYSERDPRAFDPTGLRKLCNNNERFMREMIELFVSELGETITQMENNLERKKYALLVKDAHKMAPSCRYLGAVTLALVMKEIESAMVTKGDASRFPALLQKTKEEAGKIIAQLKIEIDLMRST